jgi:hypothetical protein
VLINRLWQLVAVDLAGTSGRAVLGRHGQAYSASVIVFETTVQLLNRPAELPRRPSAKLRKVKHWVQASEQQI